MGCEFLNWIELAHDYFPMAVSIKGRQFLEHVSENQLLYSDPALCNYDLGSPNDVNFYLNFWSQVHLLHSLVLHVIPEKNSRKENLTIELRHLCGKFSQCNFAQNYDKNADLKTYKLHTYHSVI
jgi:hypothetical protein